MLVTKRQPVKVTHFEDVKGEYEQRWASCIPWVDKSVANLCLQNRDKYSLVATKIGCPWYVVAVLHYRESSFNFGTCLHNGDPLPGPTKHVPVGRGPFKNWPEAAIDALRGKNFISLAEWSMPRVLFKLEGYNGFGYRNHGYPSPYIYSGTQVYQSGKYDADGQFNPAHVDQQQGCMAILKHLEPWLNLS